MFHKSMDKVHACIKELCLFQTLITKLVVLFVLPRVPKLPFSNVNRPFSYSASEPGSSVIFIQFYIRGSIEWR